MSDEMAAIHGWVEADTEFRVLQLAAFKSTRDFSIWWRADLIDQNQPNIVCTGVGRTAPAAMYDLKGKITVLLAKGKV